MTVARFVPRLVEDRSGTFAAGVFRYVEAHPGEAVVAGSSLNR